MGESGDREDVGKLGGKTGVGVRRFLVVELRLLPALDAEERRVVASLAVDERHESQVRQLFLALEPGFAAGDARRRQHGDHDARDQRQYAACADQEKAVPHPLVRDGDGLRCLRMIRLQQQVERLLEAAVLEHGLGEVQLGRARDFACDQQGHDVLADRLGAGRLRDRLVARGALRCRHLQRAQLLHSSGIGLHRAAVLLVHGSARLPALRREQLVDQRGALAVTDEQLGDGADLAALRLGQRVDLAVERLDAREAEGDQRGERGEQQSEAGKQQEFRLGAGEREFHRNQC